MLEQILFTIFAILILGCGLLAVTLRNLLHAAIAMMGCLLASGALFLLLYQEFVALMEVMVYVGGVIIFVVYTILLTSRTGQETFAPTPAKLVGSLVVAGLVFAGLATVVVQAGLDGREAGQEVGLTEIGGRLLRGDEAGFLLPFELISILLLSALIGAATVAQYYHLGDRRDRSRRADDSMTDETADPADQEEV